MKTFACTALILTALSFVTGPANADTEAGQHLFINGWLVDGTGGPAQENTWVHVHGDKIAGVGQGRPPTVRGARVIDMKGKTLLPGLADMHGHLTELRHARWMTKVLLAHGVTTVLDPANSLGNIAAIRRWAEREDTLPHLYFANSPIQGSYTEQRFLQPGREIEGLMAEYAAFGVDFIKVYNWLSSAGLVQVGELARQYGIPVTGHTPLSWTSLGSIDAGNSMLQHLRLRPFEVIDDLEVVAQYPVDGSLMKRTGFWSHFRAEGHNAKQTLDGWERRKGQFFVTPTLVVQRAVAESYDYPDAKFESTMGIELLSAGMLEQFRQNSPPLHWGKLTPDEIDEAKRSFEGMAKFVGLAHQRGIRVLSGTDIPIPWMIPGMSLHRELTYFVQLSGMTPVEAIRTSTGWAAEALAATNRGTVANGKIADLVVVDGNLAQDIENLRSIEWVMLGGRLFTPEQLLDQANEWARQDPAEDK